MSIQAVVVQSFNHVWLFATPLAAALQASLSFTISWNLHKLMSIELVMPSNHLIFCHPVLLLPWIFTNIRVFSSESALLIRWPKHWNFSIIPCKEHSGSISFRIDWFDLAVQGTLKSLFHTCLWPFLRFLSFSLHITFQHLWRAVFLRQEYCSGLSFPSPGDLPNAEMEPASLSLAGRFLTTEPSGKTVTTFNLSQFKGQKF